MLVPFFGLQRLRMLLGGGSSLLRSGDEDFDCCNPVLSMHLPILSERRVLARFRTTGVLCVRVRSPSEGAKGSKRQNEQSAPDQDQGDANDPGEGRDPLSEERCVERGR
jgi:hypothetical protein